MEYAILTNKHCWWMRTYLGLEEDYIKVNKRYEEEAKKTNIL